MAFYGWPYRKCQSDSCRLPQQLRSGIRVLDIRLSVISNRLIAYHSTTSQKECFSKIVQTVYDFLRSEEGKSECVIMSIKQEDFNSTPWIQFSDLVRKEVYFHNEIKIKSESQGGEGGNSGSSVPDPQLGPSKDMWWLHNRVPTLGEVRGKIVLFSRFGGDGSGWDDKLEGIGIHPTTWPDSQENGFQWLCKDTVMKTNDW